MTAGVGSSRSLPRSREGTHARVRTSITHRSSTRRDRPGVRPGDDLATALEQVARLGAQLLLQAAVEAEVTGFLGRDRYARAASTEGAATGQRNGYCPTTVKTTAGPVTLSRPKLRGTTEAFASQLFGTGVTRTNALEALVIASFVRGLSTRDVGGAGRRPRGAGQRVPVDGVAD